MNKTRPVDKAETFTLNPTKPHAAGPHAGGGVMETASASIPSRRGVLKIDISTTEKLTKQDIEMVRRFLDELEVDDWNPIPEDPWMAVWARACHD